MDRKRGRSSSLSELDDSDIEEHFHPTTKYHRAPSPHQFVCDLPPSCTTPQHFGTQAELDAHKASLHTWVCTVPIRDKPGRIGEGADIPLPDHFSGRDPGTRGKSSRWRQCGKVFPDARILELHETETHDPLAREKIERGESIFACFLPPEQCGKVFSTPKKRRWHLINDHGYPNQYFFAITNHGLNQLTRTDGPAASLIRPRRDFPEREQTRDGTSPEKNRNHHNHPHPNPHPHTFAQMHREPTIPREDVDMDALTAKMAGMESSLSFVPRNVARRARKPTREY